ncbi:MAG TPA: MBL fold metallo-hydrolase [Arenibaculum sp.]|nr:MBL fold metallo-hydrolase [Arenibaculum sp.]
MRIDRRGFIQGSLALGGTALLASTQAPADASAQTGVPASAAGPLSLHLHTGNDGGFLVNSTLVAGAREAVLIDAQFSFANAHRLLAEILETGRKVTTVYVTHAHPDHYFGIAVIREAFPDLRVVAAAATIEGIERTAESKIAEWAPRLGRNVPTRAIVPDLLEGGVIDLEGHRLEVIEGLQGDIPENTIVWIPDLKAVVTGDTVYGGCHVWTADAGKAERAAWMRTLDRIEALAPEVVVPGHFKTGTPTSLDATVGHTRDYLTFFGDVVEGATTSTEVVAAVRERYPDLSFGMALEVGAKVRTGEMEWH